jgi:FKBP-type peptidyl-prolyl cis-trans isomerase FklB
MKLKLVALGMIIALMGAVSCKKGGSGSKSPENPKLKTKMDSVSYALGYALSGILKGQVGITDSSGLDYNILKIAMQRAVAGDSLLVDEMKVRTILGAFQNEQMVRQQAEMQRKDAEMQKKNAPTIAKNEKEGSEFLAKNKTAPGVVTTASGLQYKIVKAGSGAKPTAADRVKVHYTGKLLDGKVFDSSVERGQPAVMEVGKVIPGWTEAIQLMPVGSKWELYIPSTLAYDKSGNEVIPGGSTLIFEVELLSIEKGPSPDGH